MTDSDELPMTSNRPYLIRAMYEWITDNGMTPYLLVDASVPGLRVPPNVAKDGRVVLNVAARAVAHLDLGNELVRFLARFGGVSQEVLVPVRGVLAVYAQENGQGMMLGAAEDEETEAGEEPPQAPDAGGDESKARRSHLRVVK